jgi:cardiolipin synthase
MARSLIVLPDDSARPILAAIEGASRTLRVKMFVFSDPGLLTAVIAARRRGVTVRVMLNPARRSGEHDNDATRKALERVDIDVKDASPAFDLTHEKSMVVDEETAFVKSLNWATRNLTETRDYAVVTSRRQDTAEIIECFEADWHRHGFDPHHKSHLVWCPGPGRDRICRLIDEARRTLADLEDRIEGSAQLLALEENDDYAGS